MKSTGLLGIDIGTTHCKVGLFRGDGASLRAASRPTLTRHAPEGYAYYDPEELWVTVLEAVQEVTASTEAQAVGVAAVGVAGMGESGVLIDRQSGRPRFPFLPWFDTAATEEGARIAQEIGDFEIFQRTGHHPSFKCSLAKLLWLRDRAGVSLEEGVWLSAPSYIVYRLTHGLGMDYSQAVRTLAFNVETRAWDTHILKALGMTPDLFPPSGPGSASVGRIMADTAVLTGLPNGIPAVVAGHDHIAGSFGAGVSEPGQAFDSMGTAETLVGVIADQPLAEPEFASGLTYGCHTLPGRMYWMGGLSASGGSVEWLRGILGNPPLSYDELDRLLAAADSGPVSLLYFPYLTGSSSPHTDSLVRGAFLGLNKTTSRAEMLKAVLQGAAFELELVRQAAEQALERRLTQITVAGGGTRNLGWLQIKSDVSGCRYQVAPDPEATLLGAALLAGIGAGVFASPKQALAAVTPGDADGIIPDLARHARYQELYREGFLSMQAPLRLLGKRMNHAPE